jgi:hypothetical protein
MRSINGNMAFYSAMMMLASTFFFLAGTGDGAVYELDDSSPTRDADYILSGFVFDSTGTPVEGPFMGPPTQIKVVELNESSMPMVGGAYSISSIPPGTYTVRAYFGSIDHSVIYRELIISENTTLNWTHGENWMTGTVMDSSLAPITPPFMGPPTTVKVVETDQSTAPDMYGNFELSNLSIGGYYTIRAYFGSIDHSTNYIRVPVGGSPPNIHDFVHGNTGLYGYVYDTDGSTPLSGEKVELVSNGLETTTNDDGFYTFTNITTGANDTLKVTFVSKDNDTMEEEVEITGGDLGPYNITYVYVPEYTGLQLDGYVFDASGSPISGPFTGPPTSIKIVELNISAMPMGGGYYSFVNLSSGTYTVRAYFGSMDHSVIYRKLVFKDNMTLNWTHGKTWITGRILDSAMDPISGPFMGPPTTVKNVNTGESAYPDTEGRFELSNITIGDYILFRAYYGSIDHFSSYKMMKAIGDVPNDHDFINGKNSIYGFVFDVDGTTPLEGEAVEAQPSGISTTTNEDGFYTLLDLPTGQNQTVTVTFTSKNNEIAVEEIEVVSGDAGYLNFTFGLILPDTPVFETESSVVDPGDFVIEWREADNADEYFLLEDGILVYEGTGLSTIISGKVAGSFEYILIAGNENGNSSESDPIIITIRAGSSSDDLWVPGMEWIFMVESESAGIVDIDNMTMTVLEKETVQNVFEDDVESYKVRRGWQSEPETISYMWFDTVNLDKVSGHTDYGQYSSEMAYGWEYASAPRPFEVGKEIDLTYDAQIKVSVPGHPLITRNSDNVFKVEGMENVTVPFGTFECYNITITDKDDGVVSWNYFYSPEIRYWVKMIDRLSDGMSDVVTYTLKDASIPSIPVITTESGEIDDRNITIRWSEYSNAIEYLLYEGENLVYNGTDLEFTLVNRPNGLYEFTLRVMLPTGLSEVSEMVTIMVNWSVPVPEFSTESQTFTVDTYTISWMTVEGGERYVLHEDDKEIYNGTELSYQVNGKANGLYRYRVRALNSTYEASEFSSSLLITVDVDETVVDDDDDGDDEDDDDSTDNTIYIVIVVLVIIAMIILIFFVLRNRGKGDQEDEAAYTDGDTYDDETMEGGETAYGVETAYVAETVSEE